MQKSIPLVNLQKGALTRIQHDLNHLAKNPVPNINIWPLDDNIMVLHADLNVVEGLYNGTKLHLVFKMPDDYPYSPPMGFISSGHPFTSEFHEHVFDNNRAIHTDDKIEVGGYSICIDMLSNFQRYFGTSINKSGWNPAYTLTTVLLQLCTFFADPDLPRYKIPSQKSIENMIAQSQLYKCKTCEHFNSDSLNNSDKKELHEPESNDQNTNDNDNSNHQVDPQDKPKKQCTKIIPQSVIEKLSCSFTKLSVFDDDRKLNPNVILGYPLHVTRQNNKMSSEMILDLISYDSFISELQRVGFSKLELYNDVCFKSASGASYNHWLPIFIHSAIWEKNKHYVKNSISIIHNGTPIGIESNDFREENVLDVLPALMNQMVVHMMKGTTHQSISAIEAYCHLLRLLMAFLDEYPKLQQTINRKVSDFINDPAKRRKYVIPDLGQFIILIFLSDFSYYSDINLKKALLEEFFTRNILWMKRENCFDKLNKSKKSITRLSTERLPTLFQSVQVSNKLLVFYLKVAKVFIFKGVKEELDNRFGVPPEKISEGFQQTIIDIKNISSYDLLIPIIGATDIFQNKESFIDFLKTCYYSSISCGYTKD